MLVQRRPDSLRLITQHDHALLSGELAAAWHGVDGADVLSIELLLAVALHDVSWRELDRRPLWDPETGRPHDFSTYPRALRVAPIREGVEEVGRLHPRAGRLVTLHYRRLGIDAGMPEPEPHAQTERELEFIRLFDNFSLFLCLASPGSSPEGHYAWLHSPRLASLPDGKGALSLTWKHPSSLSVEPYPLRATPLVLTVPYRELPATRFESQSDLDEAWKRAPEESMELRLLA